MIGIFFVKAIQLVRYLLTFLRILTELVLAAPALFSAWRSMKGKLCASQKKPDSSTESSTPREPS